MYYYNTYYNVDKTRIVLNILSFLNDARLWFVTIVWLWLTTIPVAYIYDGGKQKKKSSIECNYNYLLGEYLFGHIQFIRCMEECLRHI